jgi:hypothetical protein
MGTKVVNTDMVPISLALAMCGQLLLPVRTTLLHDATSVPQSTYCTLLRSPSSFTRGSPTLAAPQTGRGFGTFHITRNPSLTSVNAQCTLVSFPTLATR